MDVSINYLNIDLYLITRNTHTVMGYFDHFKEWVQHHLADAHGDSTIA